MVTVITIATSDIKHFEKACNTANIKFYRMPGDRVVTPYRVIHRLPNTLFLLGWMTARNKFIK